MVKSLLGIVTVLLIVASPCFAAESKGKPKADVAPAATKYDKLCKKELQEVLKKLQKEVLVAQRKALQATKIRSGADKAYESASDEQKPDALLRMLESRVAAEQPVEHYSRLRRDFFAAQEAYLKLLRAELTATKSNRKDCR